MELAIDWKVMTGLGYRDYFAMIEGIDLDVVPVDQVLYLMGARRFLSWLIQTYRDEWGVLRRFTDDLLPIPSGIPSGQSRISSGSATRPRAQSDPGGAGGACASA